MRQGFILGISVFAAISSSAISYSKTGGPATFPARKQLYLHATNSGQGQLSKQISSVLELMIENGEHVNRILECWNDFSEGKTLRCFVQGNSEIEQQADCFVKGLAATPFHNLHSDTRLHWALELQKHTNTIKDEVIL